MRIPTRLLAASLAAAAAAQGQPQDIGLTLSPGIMPVALGQVCGPVGCQPLPGGTVLRGGSLTYVVFAAPVSPYVLGIGLSGSCLPIPGIGNVLLLGQAPVALQVSVTSAPPIVRTLCDQGLAVYVLTVPPAAPAGLVFRVQPLGVSNSGAVAFGPALETTIQ